MTTATTHRASQRSRRLAFLRESYPYYLAGKPVAANRDLEVIDKYTQESAAHVARADPAAIDEAIAAAAEAFGEFRNWKTYQRKAVLKHIIDGLEARRDELARVLTIEAGKPITYARGEVTRAIDTFTVAMEESTRMYGEVQPLEISERAAGYQGLWKRVPIGPCSFISPWNFPLNLVAHKIAPALAVGCPFVLKPASYTPVSALILGEILAETELPRGTFSILPCSSRDAGALTEDDRIKLLSFTGSPAVGWELKNKAGKKKVVLELGGNAACIVDGGVDLEDAASRLIFGAFYQSGQSCISVQRILAHESVYDELRDLLTDKVGGLKAGDPMEDETFIGPVITEDDAQRIGEWVNEATGRGASVLVGGKRDGVFYDATLLEDVPHDVRVSCQEVFGPVATLERFSDFDDALRIVNDSDYGLQAGVFTRDIHRAFRAWNQLEVGGVCINEVPSARVDAMPYGGVKDSGLGREGVRFSMEDMTEIRLMLMRDVG